MAEAAFVEQLERHAQVVGATNTWHSSTSPATDETHTAAIAAGDLSGLCVLVNSPQRWTTTLE